MHVIRLFYNRDLLKKITGMEQPPTNYNSFIKLWGKLMAAYMFASLPHRHLPLLHETLCQRTQRWSSERVDSLKKWFLFWT